MLKKRIVASLVVKNDIVVQSIGFKEYLPVGRIDIAVEFLNNWGIDEIIILDIDKTRKGEDPNVANLNKASTKCHIPIAIGGGITKIEHIKSLMNNGADKVCLNNSALINPKLISEAAAIYGNQSVVVSIDVLKTEQGYFVYDYINNKTLNISPSKFAYNVEKLGAGEVLINSVTNDGLYCGYDYNLLNKVCEEVSVPVIACGGAKNAYDIIKVLQKTNVSAACAGNFFHFFEHSVNISKSLIYEKNEIRLETHANYKEHKFDENSRLLKKDDNTLEEMLYTKIEKEII